MARGQVELWKKVSALAKCLLQDQHQAIVLEGMDLANHQVRAAFDTGYGGESCCLQGGYTALRLAASLQLPRGGPNKT